MVFVQFVGLQVLDVLTTLLFLQHGVIEGNPLMRTVLAVSVHPAVGLALAKAVAIAVALMAWRLGRCRILRKINFLYAACVAWNLLVLALQPAMALAG
jgi:hypothetical protein